MWIPHVRGTIVLLETVERTHDTVNNIFKDIKYTFEGVLNGRLILSHRPESAIETLIYPPKKQPNSAAILKEYFYVAASPPQKRRERFNGMDIPEISWDDVSSKSKQAHKNNEICFETNGMLITCSRRIASAHSGKYQWTLSSQLKIRQTNLIYRIPWNQFQSIWSAKQERCWQHECGTINCL